MDKIDEDRVQAATNDLVGIIDMWYDEGNGRDMDLTDEEFQEVLIRAMKELLPPGVIVEMGKAI